MHIKMEKLQCFNAFIIFFTLSVKLTNVVSCPTNCFCAGQTQGSVRCQGLSAWPSGLTNAVTSLSLSGLPTQRNTLNHIQQANFQTLTNLYTLIITYSEVRTIDDGAFAGLNNLRDLNLANNQLSSLNGENFRGLPKLRTLDVSGNRKCYFDKTLFVYLKDIEELNLGDMGISKLSTDIFSELNKLKVLKLYSNDLVQIKPAVLAPLALLETLDLNGNLLRELPKVMKQKLNSLKSLHLSQNPWECHCQMYWLRELKHEFLINGIEGGEVICNGPAKVRYQSYLHVPDDEFVCTPPKIIRCDQIKYSIDVHHTLTMHCDFEGNPIPDVKWVKPGGTEFVGTGTTHGQYTVLDNGTLVINGIDKPDDGQWTFQVFNGTASDSTTVTVEVTGITTTTLSTPSTSTTTTTTTSTTTTTPTTTTKTTSTTTTKSTSTITTTATSTTTTTPTTTTKPTSSTKLTTITSSTRPSTTTQPSSKSYISSTSAVSSLTQTKTSISAPKTPVTLFFSSITSLSSRKTSLILPRSSAKSSTKSRPNTGTSSPSSIAVQSTQTTSGDKQPSNAINIGLIVASGIGGGTLVGVCGIIIMCCKRKSNAEKSKIKPYDDL